MYGQFVSPAYSAFRCFQTLLVILSLDLTVYLLLFNDGTSGQVLCIPCRTVVLLVSPRQHAKNNSCAERTRHSKCYDCLIGLLWRGIHFTAGGGTNNYWQVCMPRIARFPLVTRNIPSLNPGSSPETSRCCQHSWPVKHGDATN